MCGASNGNAAAVDILGAGGMCRYGQERMVWRSRVLFLEWDWLWNKALYTLVYRVGRWR